ncbi:MAG TPA: DUF2784 domain-containing protein [Gemmatimonadaceae bacterium]|nr:DUF2784 domain-containing protein [Gemmatimonadaceae bacterium]
MWYRRAADLVLLVHFAFVAFVVLGGVLALRWRRLVWIHVPVAIYGAVIEFAGFVCPLTPLENRLRAMGGEAGYRGGFVEHYIVRVLYPAGLTRGIQYELGALVLAINIVIYAIWFSRRGARASRG